MKRNRLVALFILMLVLAGTAYPAASPTQRHLTLLVVPARYNVLQVAFDAASLAPVALVSYQGEATTENPVLHAWNGSEWVYITMQDFREAHFLQVTPGQAILVGDETLLPPGLVTSAAGWCPKTMTVPATDPAGLVNALGAHLAFTRSDWKWIASRYNMNLQDLNADRRHESWYDQKGYRDELTPRLQSLPRHRRGRSRSDAETTPATETSAPASTVVPPAEVIEEPAENVAPAVEPRLTIPEPPVEPEVKAEEPEAKKGRKGKAKNEVSTPAEAGTPPEGWQEKAVSTESPVK
ncbi:MAG: hypothetical protein KJ726_02340 [Verrucomicrobia bacterium]|nr:hypothetical protein [Verrucomicrobiota bacterium]